MKLLIQLFLLIIQGQPFHQRRILGNYSSLHKGSYSDNQRVTASVGMD